GLGRYYDAELAAADRLVSDLLERLPAGTSLVVTADHGQLETGRLIEPHPAVLAHTSSQSGEARFRWLHARPGRSAALLEAAVEHHGGDAWVRTRDEIVKEGWFGPRVTDAAASRLGDVALVAQRDVAFVDP